MRHYLELSTRLLDSILACLPMRFNLVATLVHTPQGWEVFVWEIAALATGRTEGVFAELISTLPLDVPEWLDMTPPDPQFVPGSETLVTRIPDNRDWSHTVFWDVRTGRPSHTVAGADILAASRVGGVVIGNKYLWGQPAIWNTSSHVRVPERFDPDLPVHRCVAARFAPDGAHVAALLEPSGVGVGGALWRVVILRSESGERVCELAAPEGHNLERVPAVSFDFDGNHIAICRGFRKAAVRLRVIWEEGHCTVVRTPMLKPCDDISMPGGLRLEIGDEEARVFANRQGQPNELLRRTTVRGLGRRSRARFSPDGQKALVCETIPGICHVWVFSDGTEPRRVEQRLSSVSFTADSSALVGIAVNHMEADLFDLRGRRVLRFGANSDEVVGFAVAEVTIW